MTAVEDLDEWQQKSVSLTESADLLNLEKFAQYAIAVAARTKVGLGRLSEKVTVKIKPEDVPLNLRAHDVSTHSMTLSWSPPIRLNPINYKVNFFYIFFFLLSGNTQIQLLCFYLNIRSHLMPSKNLSIRKVSRKLKIL